MTYNALAESVALIEAGHAEPAYDVNAGEAVPMAVDVVGDAAVTMFARHHANAIEEDLHVLVRRDGAWFWLGSGGGSGGTDLLADRPVALPESRLRSRGGPVPSDPRVIGAIGSGGFLDDASNDERWISYAVIRVSASVEAVDVSGRTLGVPWHGRIPVVWIMGQAPRVVALSMTGEPLADMRLF